MSSDLAFCRILHGARLLLLLSSLFNLCSVGEVLELQSQRQSHLSEDFLDFVKGFATKILRFEHFRFALLHQFTNVSDVGVFQTVGRANRQLQFIDAAKEVFIKGRLDLDFFLRTLNFFFEVDEDVELILEDLGGIGESVVGS